MGIGNNSHISIYYSRRIKKSTPFFAKNRFSKNILLENANRQKEDSMKKFRKRMGALVIVVLMIVSLIPVAALAATPAEVTASPADATVNVGDKVTFTVSGSTFAWKVDKHDGNGFVTADSSAVTGASGETSGTLTISATTAEMNGWDFMCSTDGGDSAIKTLTVNTNTTPQINAQPARAALWRKERK